MIMFLQWKAKSQFDLTVLIWKLQIQWNPNETDTQGDPGSVHRLIQPGWLLKRGFMGYAS